MNRHIRYYFQGNAGKAHLECSKCAELSDYVEIDNEADLDSSEESETFPAQVSNLKPIHEDLEYPYTVEGILRKCDECKTYYIYRAWSPGGSEDVFRTYYYESIVRIGCLGAYLFLEEALASMTEICEQNKGPMAFHYNEQLKKLERYAKPELEKLRQRPVEIIEDGIFCFQAGVSASSKKWHAEYVKVSELAATKVISQCLGFLEPEEDHEILLKKVANLRRKNNPGIHSTLKVALKRIGWKG